ncbi:MAG: glycoside hydrolase family 1 protein [Candidatus Omnitrophica bacterium]|nr:glycoside hydrolase family 1 protein [Candidatus Omnitrophota bacterium]
MPGFLWGAATSSHQVEGSNTKNDWWAWEQEGRVKDSSGIACDHFQRFREDIQMIADLGHNAHRFSLEWSRLEPSEGQWDQSAFDHYLEIFKELHRRGIEPVVTLHHFTNPLWFSQKGGWLNPESIIIFTRYVSRVTQAFSPYVRYWITINEPLVYLYFGFIEGSWPPGIKSIHAGLKVLYHLIHAHVQAYRVIHQYYEDVIKTPVWVSIAKHMSCFTPARKDSFMDRVSVHLRNWFFNDLMITALHTGFLFFPGVFCEYLPLKNTLDFIGVNYYTRDFIRFKGWSLMNILGDLDDKALHENEVKELNVMGWEVFPDGLYHVLKRLRRYKLPVMIMENGICAKDDEQRVRFIQDHLAALKRAASEGVEIGGYFYWSLLDNFEWAHGFGPRFGIVEVDYATQIRIIRKSAYVLSESCRNLVNERVHAERSF